MAENFITGLDIGSTAVRIAVGQRAAEGAKAGLHIIGAAEVPAEGINKGVVTSIDDAVSSVSACLERAERMVGLKLNASGWVFPAVMCCPSLRRA